MQVQKLFPRIDFEKLGSLEFKVHGFFGHVLPTAVEYLDFAAYLVAKRQHLNEITEGIVLDVLSLLGAPQKVEFEKTSTQLVMTPAYVEMLSSVPFPHTTESFEMVSRYLNFELERGLQSGAQSAAKRGSKSIQTRDLLDWCDKLPYPLNLLLC
jgi:hypothetical protein